MSKALRDTKCFNSSTAWADRPASRCSGARRPLRPSFRRSRAAPPIRRQAPRPRILATEHARRRRSRRQDCTPLTPAATHTSRPRPSNPHRSRQTKQRPSPPRFPPWEAFAGTGFSQLLNLRVYGMARPSFRRRRLAGVSGGGRAMTNIAVLGVDLGKNVCSVVGLDASGAVLRQSGARVAFMA